jgi:hypothetical protein
MSCLKATDMAKNKRSSSKERKINLKVGKKL